MHFIFIIFAILKFTGAENHEFNNCGVSGQPAGLIVNGAQSNRGAWPWLVAIYQIDENKFICGGTLVSSNIIITVGFNRLRVWLIVIILMVLIKR